MTFKVTSAQKGSMHFRMEGLDPSVTNFRKSGYLTDIDHFKPSFLEEFHCSSGSDYLPTERFEGGGEFCDPLFIAYRK